MNITHLLHEQSAAGPDRMAIVDHSRGSARTLTFAQLESASSGLAARLRGSGLRPGDAVMLLQPVSAELYVIFTALLRSGIVAVFIDPSAGRKHIDRCCAIHRPKAFIGCARAHLLRFVSPAMREIPLKFSTDLPVFGAELLRSPGVAGACEMVEDCEPDAPAIIRFTSGSTGAPKASVRTHGFLLAQQRVLQKSLRLQAGKTDLITMPMFVLSNLAAGMTSLIPRANLRSPGLIDPASLLRQIQSHRPDRIAAAPALLERLADHCLRKSMAMDCFETIFTGGAPVFPRLLDRVSSAAPRANVVAVYGSTEAEPIAMLDRRNISPSDRERMAEGQGLLAGFPDEAIRVGILPDGAVIPAAGLSASEFESVCLPPGEPGQVVVAGPHVHPGSPDERGGGGNKFVVAGSVWHQTGDAGYLDEQGRLWLLGRCCARIRDARGTLYPFQVECIAHHEPGVNRAALVAHQGARVLAIESKRGIDTAALKSKLAPAFIDTISVFPKLPVDKRHNSKIDYPALEAIIRWRTGEMNRSKDLHFENIL